MHGKCQYMQHQKTRNSNYQLFCLKKPHKISTVLNNICNIGIILFVIVTQKYRLQIILQENKNIHNFAIVWQ